jgi:hypothetical protein
MENITQPILKEEQVALPDGQDLTAKSEPVISEGAPTLNAPKKSSYCCTSCSTISIFVLLFMAIATGKDGAEICLLFALCFLIIYVRIVANSATMKYLGNVRSSAQFMEHFTDLKKKQPQLQVVSTCFHWETEYTTCFCFSETKFTPTYIPRRTNEDPISKLVVSQKNTTDVKFASVLDHSGVIPEEMLKSKAIKVKFINAFVLPDSNTVQTISEELRIARERDQNKDLNYSLELDYKVEGYKEKIIVLGPGASRFFISKSFYILMSCFLLAAPYSIWLDRVCNRAEIKIKKSLTF